MPYRDVKRNNEFWNEPPEEPWPLDERSILDRFLIIELAVATAVLFLLLVWPTIYRYHPVGIASQALSVVSTEAIFTADELHVFTG